MNDVVRAQPPRNCLTSAIVDFYIRSVARESKTWFFSVARRCHAAAAAPSL